MMIGYDWVAETGEASDINGGHLRGKKSLNLWNLLKMVQNAPPAPGIHLRSFKSEPLGRNVDPLAGSAT